MNCGKDCIFYGNLYELYMIIHSWNLEVGLDVALIYIYKPGNSNDCVSKFRHMYVAPRFA